MIDFDNRGKAQTQAAAMLAFWLLNKKRKKRKRSPKDPVQITVQVPTPGMFWVLDLMKALGALSQLN